MYLSELARIEFQNQLDAMQLNLNGCLVGEDPIHLHDLRVANRRFRAALKETKNLLPPEISRSVEDDLRWMHKSSNQIRNLDVAISHFPHYRKKISRSWREYLEPALRWLENYRLRVHQDWVDLLKSERSSNFFRCASEMLETGILEDGQSAREYGSRRITDRYGKLRRSGREVSKKSPPQEYHQFRIAAKKLRYQMEFYQSVFDPEAVDPLRIGLKAVQDALGAHQDAVVELDLFKDLAADLQRQDMVLEGLLALGQLIGRVEKTIKSSRKHSLQQIRWLINDPTARKFQSCFQYAVE